MTVDRLFTAAAHRFAAQAWAASDSEPHRRFAPVIETWAANAERRAMPDQPDLFPETNDDHP